MRFSTITFVLLRKFQKLMLFWTFNRVISSWYLCWMKYRPCWRMQYLLRSRNRLFYRFQVDYDWSSLPTLNYRFLIMHLWNLNRYGMIKNRLLNNGLIFCHNFSNIFFLISPQLLELALSLMIIYYLIPRESIYIYRKISYTLLNNVAFLPGCWLHLLI